MSERLCGNCQNTIYDDEALFCHFCGESMGGVSSGAIGKLRGAGMKWLFLVVVLLLAGMMILQLF